MYVEEWPLGRARHREKNNIKMHLMKQRVLTWARFNWFMIGSGAGLLLPEY
jgi:hypothetical protein